MTESKSMKIKLIESFGLKDLLIANFVYRPPKRGYAFKVQPDLWNQKKLFFYVINKRQAILVKHPLLEPSIIVGPRSYCPTIYITQMANQNLSDKIDSVIAATSQKISDSLLQTVQFDDGTQVLLNGQEIKQKHTNCGTSFSSYKQEERYTRILVIYSHGNASDLGDVFGFARKLVEVYKVDILAYDYTGYGLGSKRFKPSESVIYEDIQNILAYAVCKLGYYLHEIILWGFSLGSCPTVEIASRYSQIGGVVLQAPLASLKLWIDEKYQQKNSEFFANINKIQSIKCPIIIVHGQKDTVINVNHSRMLYQKHQKTNPDSTIHLIEVSQVDHNDLHEIILSADNPLFNKINEFVQDIEEHAHFFSNYFRLKTTKLELSTQDLKLYEAKLEFELREEELLKLVCDETSVLKDQLNQSLNTSYQTSTSAYTLFNSEHVDHQKQYKVHPEPLLEISTASNHSVLEPAIKQKPNQKQHARAQQSALSCLMCSDDFE